LATTFVSRDRNEDIHYGNVARGDLQRPPFKPAVPVELFDEAHPSIDFDDKHLALWCGRPARHARSV
jgi:hypothetical protein